jgi:hypothetical protein
MCVFDNNVCAAEEDNEYYKGEFISVDGVNDDGYDKEGVWRVDIMGAPF